MLNGVNSLDHWADKFIDARDNGTTIMKAFLKIRQFKKLKIFVMNSLLTSIAIIHQKVRELLKHICKKKTKNVNYLVSSFLSKTCSHVSYFGHAPAAQDIFANLLALGIKTVISSGS